MLMGANQGIQQDKQARSETYKQRNKPLPN